MLKLQVLLTLLLFSCASLDIDTDDKDGHSSVKYPKNSRIHVKNFSPASTLILKKVRKLDMVRKNLVLLMKISKP